MTLLDEGLWEFMGLTGGTQLGAAYVGETESGVKIGTWDRTKLLVGGLLDSFQAASFFVGAVGTLVDFGAAVPEQVGLREVLPAPKVSDARVQNIINNLYSGTSNPRRLGYGTTAEALAHEFATGEQVGGKWHLLKGIESYNGFRNFLEQNPGAPWHDKVVIETLMRELEGLNP
jgi:hypothetical protein